MLHGKFRSCRCTHRETVSSSLLQSLFRIRNIRCFEQPSLDIISDLEGRGRMQLPVCAPSGELRVCRHRSESASIAFIGVSLPRLRDTRSQRWRPRSPSAITLDEIKNAVTGNTYACFEPALDYVVVKFPKWPFDKFVYAKRTLGTQMKATGEVMAIGRSFEEALMKAVRGAEISHDTLDEEALSELSDERIARETSWPSATMSGYSSFTPRSEREASAAVEPYPRDHRPSITGSCTSYADIIARLEQSVCRTGGLEPTALPCGLQEVQSTLDAVIARSWLRPASHGERDQRPTRWSTPARRSSPAANPVLLFLPGTKRTEAARHFIEEDRASGTRMTGEPVIVFGSGPDPHRPGNQEIDYASVHCVWALLKEAGYEVVIVNNNPETDSTDFDTADRLYFEPLDP